MEGAWDTLLSPGPAEQVAYILHSCCLKPPRVWYFAPAAPGH